MSRSPVTGRADLGSTVLRAEVVGSLLRPPAVVRAAEQHAAGQIDDGALERAQSQAIEHVLKMQAQCGLEVCTDGEVRRTHFADPLLSGLHCFGSAPGQQEAWRDAEGRKHDSGDTRAVTSRLEFSGTGEADSFRFAAQRASLPVKVTVPSPTYLLSRWLPGVSSAAYPDPFELFQDTAEILVQIVAELVQAGCRYVQFDAPELTAVVDQAALAQLQARGIAADRLVHTACELMDAIVDSAPPDVKFAVHLCRGNLRGLWRKSGGYEALSETFFTRLNGVGTFMLEFDDERSGSFESLGRLPDDKVAVLGLITTKRGELESVDALVARVNEAARVVPLERLAISTQCGFASTAEGNPLTQEEQWRKLELVAQVARTAWAGV